MARGTSPNRDAMATTGEPLKDTRADHQRSPLFLVPPPIVYAVFFGTGMLVDWALPWSPAWLQHAPARGTGLILLLAAAWLGMASLGRFLRRGTTVFPHGRPTQLITNGPYSFSRNPVYVALTAAYCGGAIMVATLWPVVLLPVPLAFMDWVIIPFEERRLRETFGVAYEDYCRRVRRWL
jgi:protein-S-isoprenylcysteine O-methyltransferase Ste14